MSGIKCAVVAAFFGPYYNNFVASLIAFEKGMKRQGNSVIYVFPKEIEMYSWIGRVRESNPNIYFVKYDPYSLNNLLQMRKIFKNEKIDIVYAHMSGWDVTVRLATPKLPVIWHMHMNTNVSTLKKKVRNWIKFHVLGFGKTYHIAVSQPGTDAINSLNPHNKCICILNALDFSRLTIDDNKRKQVQMPTILMFGWAPYVKGVDLAIDACEKINASGNSVRLCISSQEKTYEYVRKRFSEQPKWLELIPPTNNVSELYQQATIMLSASRSEGFSYALQEALYMGLPLICSDIPGTNWTNEFQSVRTFTSENVKELIEQISATVIHEISKNEIQENRDLLQRKYSLDVWAEKTVKIVSDIAKQRK